MALMCGAVVVYFGLFLVARGINGIDERVSLAERRLHLQREWLCLHSDQLMLLADLAISEAYSGGRIDGDTLAQWNDMKAKCAAMQAEKY